jgi:hypothetical protein
MSAESDVVAHAFGFLVGTALGVALPYVFPQPPGARAQYVLLLFAFCIVAASWVVAR